MDTKNKLNEVLPSDNDSDLGVDRCMATISMRVASLSMPASSVKSKKRVVRTVTRADVVSANRSIEPKIHQNKRERIDSMIAAEKCIVGERLN